MFESRVILIAITQLLAGYFIGDHAMAWYTVIMKKGRPKKDWDPKFLRSMLIIEFFVFIYIICSYFYH